MSHLARTTCLQPRNGFFTQGFGPAVPSSGSSVLIVERAGVATDVRMRLWRHAVLAGTIRGEGGEPVAGAKMMLLSQNPVWPSWGPRVEWGAARDTSTISTDASGRYTFDALRPGSYVMEVLAGDVPVSGGRAYGLTFGLCSPVVCSPAGQDFRR